jgi:hypothetical protein
MAGNEVVGVTRELCQGKDKMAPAMSKEAFPIELPQER